MARNVKPLLLLNTHSCTGIAAECIRNGQDVPSNGKPICCAGLAVKQEPKKVEVPKSLCSASGADKCWRWTLVKRCRPETTTLRTTTTIKASTAQASTPLAQVSSALPGALVAANARTQRTTTDQQTTTTDQQTTTAELIKIEPEAEAEFSMSLVLYIAAMCSTIIVLLLATCVAAWIYCKRRNDIRRAEERRREKSNRQIANV